MTQTSVIIVNVLAISGIFLTTLAYLNARFPDANHKHDIVLEGCAYGPVVTDTALVGCQIIMEKPTNKPGWQSINDCESEPMVFPIEHMFEEFGHNSKAWCHER